MFRLNLKETDSVLACMPVSQARYVVRGSVVTACDECDVSVWRAPGRPLRVGVHDHRAADRGGS